MTPSRSAWPRWTARTPKPRARRGAALDGGGVSLNGTGKALRGVAQRLGGTRLGVLAIGRIVSPLQRKPYRGTGGRLSLTGRAPVRLPATTGRRGGNARTVRLLYIRAGDRLVTCNVHPGFERPDPWILNLRAGPHAHVQAGRDAISVRARMASGRELDRCWPQLTKIRPACQGLLRHRRPAICFPCACRRPVMTPDQVPVLPGRRALLRRPRGPGRRPGPVQPAHPLMADRGRRAA